MCLGPVKGSHKCKVQQIPPHCSKSDSPDDSVRGVGWGRDLDSASVPGCENAATVGGQWHSG